MNLKEIDLGYCKYLSEVPNLSRSLKLERIDLVGCKGLIEIPLYFQHLHKLTYLRLSGCHNITYLPAMPCNVEFNDFSHTAMISDSDVFISFRGEDTRNAFTNHLHAALLEKKIEAYMGYGLEKGDDIGRSLREAIKKSKIAVIVFSKNYASSAWCLKELVHILECKKSSGKIVIPIFYGINPLHVRKQQGTYAFYELEKRFKGIEVVNWRAALEEVAAMSGFHYSSKTGRTEADFAEEVVQYVLTKFVGFLKKQQMSTRLYRGLGLLALNN